MVVEMHGLLEMQAEAERFCGTLSPRPGSATVIALSGELGAGKTAFVQAVAHAFGIEIPVTSPTFVIENVYELPLGAWKRLIHIDAYRLAQSSELAHLGWADIVADPANLILIEWPEHVRELMPADTFHISFTFVDEHTRSVAYGKKI